MMMQFTSNVFRASALRLATVGLLACSWSAVPAYAAGGGDGHGGSEEHGGGHHVSYSADDDHDGTANWMDGDSEAYVLSSVGFHAINLAILLALVWVGFGGKIRDTLAQRAISIRSNIQDAQRAKTEAEARHAAIAARLAAIETEISGVISTAEEVGAAEEKRLRERADAVGRQIAETATRQIADEAARASQRLRREAVELAVELAEGIVTKQLKEGDQQRLAEQFLASVNSSPIREGEA